MRKLSPFFLALLVGAPTQSATRPDVVFVLPDDQR